MKFVDLAERLENYEDISIAETARILAGVCDQLHLIHEQGQMHQNIKPENILISEINRIYLVDFGSSRPHRDTAAIAVYTSDGVIKGDVDYVSPEYIRATQIDRRSDIFAVGVLGYRILTGKLPFDGETVYMRMTARLEENPESIRSILPDCPEALDKIIVKALEVDPDLRYQTAVAMRNALNSLLEELGERRLEFDNVTETN